MRFPNPTFRSSLPLALVALALCALTAGCAHRGQPIPVTGRAYVEAAARPDEARQVALESALIHANRQIYEMARQEPMDGGGTLGDMMDQSSYVRSRVLRAIQRSPIRHSAFYDDGAAEVVVEMRMAQILDVARDAWSELAH